jgi:pantetheine-phosphate adenylyltransferase
MSATFQRDFNYKKPESLFRELEKIFPKLAYHNILHTESFDWQTCPSLEAFWAAVFHDSVYNPKNKTNEEDSIELYHKMINSLAEVRPNHERVHNLIYSTKDHVKFYDASPDMKWLHRNDLACFRAGANIEQNERNIFREYQFIPSLYHYKQERFKVLTKYYTHPLVDKVVMDSIIEFLDSWTPKYAVFSGSFNPWHRGHLDILQQAEKIFDKVIIAQGQNEDKEYAGDTLSQVGALKFHHVEKYEGSLFNYLNEKKKELGNLTLIRGLRNADDLIHESALFNFGQKFSEVPFAYFLSKSENTHISSSSIRKLDKLGLDTGEYLC